jgi:hypothetical protein
VLGENESTVFENGVRILKKLPKLVLVKFKKPDGSDVDWQIEGLDEKGLYPVVPKASSWFLDKGRMHPVLKIKRRQIPLAPAFAMTSHAAQGQTLKKGAIVDLCIGKGTNPLGSYVAITRITHRRHLLIYRPFDRDLFAQGEREGPVLLLKHLRGEEINWKEIEEKYMPSRRCVGCNFVNYKDAFQVGQWNREDKISFCKVCVERKKTEKTPFRCNNCGVWKSEDSFPKEYRTNWSLRTRVCTECEERRRCRGKCKEAKPKTEFTASEWVEAGKPHSRQGKCQKCMGAFQSTKVCSGPCKKRLPFDSFGKRQWEKSDDSRKCKDCVTKNQEKKRCSGSCREELAQSAYSERQWREGDGIRKCLNCVEKNQEKKRCSGRCQKDLAQIAYSKRQWREGDGIRKCLKCVGNKKNHWYCVHCKETKHKEEFSLWSNSRQTVSNKATAWCDVCKRQEAAEQIAMASANAKSVIKKK